MTLSLKGTSLGTFCKFFLQLNLWFHMFQTIHSLKQEEELSLLVMQMEKWIHGRTFCFQTFFLDQYSMWVFLMCSQFHFISRWCSTHSFWISYSGMVLSTISYSNLSTTSTITFIWVLFFSFTGSFCLLDFCKDSFSVSPRLCFQLLVYIWVFLFTITTGL